MTTKVSSCLTGIYGQCLQCGKSLTNNHVCDPLLNAFSEAGQKILNREKKNEGLTLSEIAADEDVLSAIFIDSEGIKRYYDRDILRSYSQEMLAATDWVVVKRKSDCKKQSDEKKPSIAEVIQEQCNTICELQKENESLKARVTLMDKELNNVKGHRDELKAEIETLGNNNQMLNKELAKLTWKNWPQEKPSKHGFFLVKGTYTGENQNKGCMIAFYDDDDDTFTNNYGIKVIPSRFLELPE